MTDGEDWYRKGRWRGFRREWRSSLAASGFGSILLVYCLGRFSVLRELKSWDLELSESTRGLLESCRKGVGSEVRRCVVNFALPANEVRHRRKRGLLSIVQSLELLILNFWKDVVKRFGSWFKLPRRKKFESGREKKGGKLLSLVDLDFLLASLLKIELEDSKNLLWF